MTLCVQREQGSNQLRFEAFPGATLPYREDDPHDDVSFFHVKVTDAKLEQVLSVFLQTIHLQRIGISITTWKELSPHCGRLSLLLRNASIIERLLERAIPVVSKHLTRQHLAVFKNTPPINRTICSIIHQQRQRLSKMPELPGIYLDFLKPVVQVFINLKKTAPLGEGTFGKIRKVVWLTAPQDSSPIIAKKVLKKPKPGDESYFDKSFNTELAALREFHEKRGIISLISGGNYGGKRVMFLPLYESNLYRWFEDSQSPFSSVEINDRLSLFSQWLDGLATIFEKGIHGDLHPNNLLIRRGKQGFEGVIADFGAYRPHGQLELGLTTIDICPPENYYPLCLMTKKHDTWALGLSMHQVLAMQKLPCWCVEQRWGAASEKYMKQWTTQLMSNWILKFPTRENSPPFVVELISKMVDPSSLYRLNPKQAFERFQEGYAAFAKN